MVIDMQRIFGEPGSEWFTPDFDVAARGAEQLRHAFGPRVALTRFIAPEHPSGAWVPYYEDWPFALDPANAQLYDLMPQFPVVSTTAAGTRPRGDVSAAADVGGTVDDGGTAVGFASSSVDRNERAGTSPHHPGADEEGGADGEAGAHVEAVVIDRPTFGKWDALSSAAMGDPTEVVLVGVSTDCCVLSTALAAADSGVHVRVAADACAGVSEQDHQRALDVMSLYTPMIEITTVAAVLESLAR